MQYINFTSPCNQNSNLIIINTLQSHPPQQQNSNLSKLNSINTNFSHCDIKENNKINTVSNLKNENLDSDEVNFQKTTKRKPIFKVINSIDLNDWGK